MLARGVIFLRRFVRRYVAAVDVCTHRGMGSALGMRALGLSLGWLQQMQSSAPMVRRRHVPTDREARGWSILNPSIVHSNKCRALMNVRAIVRSVSLRLVVVRGRHAVRTGIVEATC